MIIITKTATGEVKHKLADGTKVFRNPDNIIIGTYPNDKFHYGQSLTNTTVYTGVTDTPADFDWNKYTYDGTTWTANPDYKEPTRANIEAAGGYYDNGNPKAPQPPTVDPG